MTSSPSLRTTVRTSTLSDEERGGVDNGPDVVTTLLRYGTDTRHTLRRRTTIGSAADRDIVIRDPGVSSHHCRLEQENGRLLVTDERSKNGTFFEGERANSFILKPGKMFSAGSNGCQFLALDDEMCTHYPELAEILGLQQAHSLRSETPSPADMILVACSGAPLLIESEPHCEQHRLADIVHKLSLFRARPFVELASEPNAVADLPTLVRKRARKATLVIDLESVTYPLDPTAVSMMFSSRYQVRVIALARSVDIADKAFGKNHARELHRIWLPPIANRPQEVGRLLDRMFLDEASPLRMSLLTPENESALLSYSWPENFLALRQAATWLTAVARAGSVNKAAVDLGDLGPKRSTLQNWYTGRVGLSHPLLPDAIGKAMLAAPPKSAIRKRRG